MQNFISALIFAFFYLVWAVLFYSLIRTIFFGVRSKSWPMTTGKIIDSRVELVKRSDTGMLVRKYRVVIQYEYRVNGLTYGSDVISFGTLAFQIFNAGLRSKKGADYLASKFPSGSEVKVYYQPNNPKRAVLVPGAFNVNTILMVLILSIVGILFNIVFIL